MKDEALNSHTRVNLCHIPLVVASVVDYVHYGVQRLSPPYVVLVYLHLGLNYFGGINSGQIGSNMIDSGNFCPEFLPR